MKRTKPIAEGQKTPNGQPTKQLNINDAEMMAAGHCQRRAISNRFGIAALSSVTEAHLAATANVGYVVVRCLSGMAHWGWKAVIDHRAMMTPCQAMVTTTLLIDGMLSGTGIRNAIEGGYIAPSQLNLSADLCAALAAWVSRYEQAHFSGYSDESAISGLDREGIVLRDRLADERPDHKVGYYSNALMKRLDDLPRA